ncbi:hypothetical protein V7S43_010024 [Phytophthora oleae]|uniref:Uncharacterized protein n=1 Tax=Phytophthora oleae TaxID=2107226 RepID=A0ABD3FEZ8_9STRA
MAGELDITGEFRWKIHNDVDKMPEVPPSELGAYIRGISCTVRNAYTASNLKFPNCRIEKTKPTTAMQYAFSDFGVGGVGWDFRE